MMAKARETPSERAFRLARALVRRAIKERRWHVDFRNRELAALPPELAGADSVRAVYIIRTKIADISVIGKMKSLEDLGIYNSPVMDLSPLKKCKKLRKLALAGVPATDYSSLAGLTSICTATTRAEKYFHRVGLNLESTPLVEAYPYSTFSVLPQPYATVEIINHLRNTLGKAPFVPRGYKLPEGLKIDVRLGAEASVGDGLAKALNIPSPYEFKISVDSKIDLALGPANCPVFPGVKDQARHRERLDVCRALTEDLLKDLRANKFQARQDYLEHLSRYEARLPMETGEGNILLADAAMRSLRAMFAADAVMLSPAFSAQLRTLLEQHIGLRVYYPSISEFYQDVHAGRITEAIPLDVVEGVIVGIEESTPTVFSPRVAEALREGSERGPVVTTDQGAATTHEADRVQPPKDPLGELSPDAARDYTVVAWAARLLKTLMDGKKLGERLEGWKKAHDVIVPFVEKIIKWFSDNGPPNLPPTLSV